MIYEIDKVATRSLKKSLNDDVSVISSRSNRSVLSTKQIRYHCKAKDFDKKETNCVSKCGGPKYFLIESKLMDHYANDHGFILKPKLLESDHEMIDDSSIDSSSDSCQSIDSSEEEERKKSEKRTLKKAAKKALKKAKAEKKAIKKAEKKALKKAAKVQRQESDSSCIKELNLA